MPVLSKEFLDIQATMYCGLTLLRKEFLDIQATIECGLTLKRARDMIKSYGAMHRADNDLQHGTIFWPV